MVFIFSFSLSPLLLLSIRKGPSVPCLACGHFRTAQGSFNSPPFSPSLPPPLPDFLFSALFQKPLSSSSFHVSTTYLLWASAAMKTSNLDKEPAQGLCLSSQICGDPWRHGGELRPTSLLRQCPLVLTGFWLECYLCSCMSHVWTCFCFCVYLQAYMFMFTWVFLA